MLTPIAGQNLYDNFRAMLFLLQYIFVIGGVILSFYVLGIDGDLRGIRLWGQAGQFGGDIHGHSRFDRKLSGHPRSQSGHKHSFGSLF